MKRTRNGSKTSIFSTRGEEIISTVLAWITPATKGDTFIEGAAEWHYRRRLRHLTASYTEKELELYPTDKWTWTHMTRQRSKHRKLTMRRPHRSNSIIYVTVCVAQRRRLCLWADKAWLPVWPVKAAGASSCILSYGGPPAAARTHFIPERSVWHLHLLNHSSRRKPLRRWRWWWWWCQLPSVWANKHFLNLDFDLKPSQICKKAFQRHFKDVYKCI